MRGAVYVYDRCNHRVVALDTDLKWRYTFGEGPDELESPIAIAAYRGELFVADFGGHCVQARIEYPVLNPRGYRVQ